MVIYAVMWRDKTGIQDIDSVYTNDQTARYKRKHLQKIEPELRWYIKEIYVREE